MTHTREYMRAYYAAHREHLAVLNKRWLRKNRRHVRAYRAAYYRKHSAAIKAKRRKQYYADPAAAIANATSWNRRHLKRRRVINRRFQRRHRKTIAATQMAKRHRNIDAVREIEFRSRTRHLSPNVRECRHALLLLKRWCRANGYTLKAFVRRYR